ncbi:glycosyltransferase [Haloarchaeobius amylolyticus]|uniref:Glycosyltransferase n=1 Tax=Haloarchaeobius amylolyticus TaxID=1198296 RepID=A0ABD6BCJ2_9EURY
MNDRPAFSIICVYNDRETLDEFLDTGLKNQTCRNFEKIYIDNRDSTYESASEALNEGAFKASGKYLVFIHQDVRLTPRYLSYSLSYLDEIDNLGVAGAAGVRSTGNCRSEGVNLIHHGQERKKWERGTHIESPKEVDSLDELILIVPKKVFEEERFSTSVCKGWHLYGVEYSIRMKKSGKKVVVLPLDLWHYSDGGWRDVRHDLTLLRIIHQYPDLQCIHTTGGSWPAARWYVALRILRKTLAGSLFKWPQRLAD